MIRRDFEIYRYRYMDEVELHHHDFYEIYMLLRGSVSYTVENRIFHMRAGDLMLISPLELHQARVDSNDEPYERIVLWVDRGYLESLSSPHTSLTRCFDTTVPGHTNLLRLPGPRSAEMRRELDKLRSLHMQESYGSDLLAVCSLVELMVAINQSAADRSMQSALSADMASDRVVDGVLSYINEHYNEALTLDALADKYNIDVREKAFKGLIGKGVIEGNKVILVKPQTYMNLSGEAVGEAARFYKIPADHVIVISDDISLPLGKLRVRGSGSAGGHNGLKNIIAHLGTDAFPRVKVGVGAPEHDIVDWVIGPFTASERKVIDGVLDRALGAAECIITDGVSAAQNRYNG